MMYEVCIYISRRCLKCCVYYFYICVQSIQNLFEPVDINIRIYIYTHVEQSYELIYMIRYVQIRLGCLRGACVPLLSHHRLGGRLMYTQIYMLYTIYILCMMTHFGLSLCVDICICLHQQWSILGLFPCNRHESVLQDVWLPSVIQWNKVSVEPN